MDQRKKPKKPTKLALLSVPLAVVSPALADLPATATEISRVQSASNASNVTPNAQTTELTAAVLPEIPKKQLSNYRVKTGDTVSQIAKRFGLPVSKIARLNNLGPTSLIRVGQRLVLSGSAPKQAAVESYRIRSGDTLIKIANRHGLSLEEISALNQIKPSTIIYPGQVLKVAKIVPIAESSDEAGYLVQAGDTLASIAKTHAISISSLRELNGLTKNSIIYVGQKLVFNQSAKTPATENPTPATKTPEHGTPTASVLAEDISSLDPMRPTGTCTVHGFHTVQAGETVSRISAIYGVSTQSVLSANSLGWSSTIYVGQQLSIPGIHEIQHCPSQTKLNQEMRTNAQVIFKVGKALGVSDYGIVIALATAMQESSLKNINYGDRDSIGLFQQRPSMGWGTVSEIMDPEYSSRAFFGGQTGPNFGRTPGLLDIKNWSTMTLTKASQAVQISAFPDAYQKWELSAWSWFDLMSASEI